MVEECIKKELNVVLDKDLNESDFDILLMSHVIEHIKYPEIINF